LLAALLGCKLSPPQSYDAAYRDADTKFEAGDIQAAANKVDLELNKTSTSDPAWNWKFRILKGDICIWEGKWKDALDLMEEEPPAVISLGEFGVRRKIIQGRALYLLGDLPTAYSKLIEAGNIASTTAPEWRGEVDVALGSLFHHQKKYIAAEEIFNKGLDLARQYHQRSLQARILGNLGRTYVAMERYDEAIGVLADALNLAGSLHAKHFEPPILNNLGWSYLELGDYENAVPLFIRGEHLATELGLEPYREDVLTNLGRAYSNQANYPAAIDSYSSALSIARKLGDEDSIAADLDNLALVATATGRLDEARRYNNEALLLIRKNHPEDKQVQFQYLLTSATIGSLKGNFETAQPQLLEISRQAQQSLLRWQTSAQLAKLYFLKGEDALADQEFRKTLDILDKSRAELSSGSKLEFSSRATESYTEYIQFLTSRNMPVKALQIADLMHARTLIEGLSTDGKTTAPQVEIPKIQALLKTTNQVILSYWIAPGASFLWVITPDQIKSFSLAGKQEIDQEVESYRKALLGSQDLRNANKDGEKLYQTLIEPAKALIPPNGRVVIVPDGSLNRLNFETLKIPDQPEHYWIEDVEIQNASSIALLANRSARPPVQPNNLLLIGNPMEVNKDYPALNSAKDELEGVARNFPGPTTIVSGKDAIPSVYQQNHPGQYRYIHFVTHGTASLTSPLDSAIILSPDTDKTYKLYARKIVEIPIKADLVTVSACYGAGQRVYGEGLVGLAWAFMRAGAHQVIAGLWEVDDRFTPQLMGRFYSELHGGKTAADALRTAKRSMLHSGTIYRRPYYWASLQLYSGS